MGETYTYLSTCGEIHRTEILEKNVTATIKIIQLSNIDTKVTYKSMKQKPSVCI